MKHLVLVVFFFCYFYSLAQEDSTATTTQEIKTKSIPDAETIDSLLATQNIVGGRVEYEPKDSVFLELYKDVVFKNEKSRIKIWKDEVRILFDPSVPHKHQRDLLRFASVLSSQIDSLSISKVDARSKANYLIFYMKNETDYDLEPRIKRKGGGYKISWNDKQQIYRGALKINSFDLTEAEQDFEILKYYFFLSLGYFGPSENFPCESFLSTCNYYRELTKIDLEILKYHYSYGMCKGINKTTFEELHRKNKKNARGTFRN